MIGLTQIFAILSCLGSFFIILTYLVFKDIRYLRYVEFVFYAALNDFLLSFGNTFGPASDGSPVCWFKAITLMYNSLSFSLWTTVITYQVWLVVKQGRTIRKMKLLHLICWGVPFLMTILPFTSGYYGKSSFEFCFVSNRDGVPEWVESFWIFLFFSILWMAISINIALLLAITFRLRDMQVVSKVIQSTIKRLIFYPISAIICWITFSISDTREAILREHDSSWDTFLFAGKILFLLQGFFFSVIFFSVNPKISRKWYRSITKRQFTNDANQTSETNRDTFDVTNESDYIPKLLPSSRKLRRDGNNLGEDELEGEDTEGQSIIELESHRSSGFSLFSRNSSILFKNSLDSEADSSVNSKVVYYSRNPLSVDKENQSKS